MAGSVAATYGGVLAVCRGLLALVSGGDVSFDPSPEASGGANGGGGRSGRTCLVRLVDSAVDLVVGLGWSG